MYLVFLPAQRMELVSAWRLCSNVFLLVHLSAEENICGRIFVIFGERILTDLDSVVAFLPHLSESLI